jgi:hypothetical protein
VAYSLTNGRERKFRLRLSEIDSVLVVIVSKEGVSVRAAGSRTPVTASWSRLIQAMKTPANVPSYLEGKPLELLKYKAAKRKKI